MKTTKRILATVLAVLMLVAMMCTTALASASETYTITVDNAVTGHTYTAYQLFSGTLASSVLSDINWGSGISDTYTSGKDAASCAAAIASPADAEAFAADLVTGGYLLTGVEAVDGKISGLAAGYYLVLDTTGDPLAGKNDAYSKYILRVVKDVTITPKASVPTLTKEVSLSERQEYTSSVNASFNQTVYFKLIGTLPSHIDDYITYHYEIIDLIPSAFAFDIDEDLLHVYVMNNGSYFPIDKSFYSASYAGNKLTISFDDVKGAIVDATAIDVAVEDEILIVYKADVTSAAVIGEAGNVNEAVLHYENDPNNEGTSLGTTVPAAAAVYTYQLNIDKVNGDTGAKLANATFLLYWIQGNVTEYVIVDSDGNFVGSTTDKAQATRLTTDSNGAVSVKGISGNVYHLVEESAPAGYNKLTEEVRLSITGAKDGIYSFSANVNHGSAYASITTDASQGIATVTITNTKGASLPETGGAGTTIFYVVGIVLVLGAVLVLATRKRGNA